MPAINRVDIFKIVKYYKKKFKVFIVHIKKEMQSTLHKKNSSFIKTLKRKNQLQQEKSKSRQRLKSQIQEKMRKSHHNKLKQRQKSNSSLSTRLKAQHKKIQQIKKLEITMYNEKYQKVKQLSSRTEKFFYQLEQKKKNNNNKSRDITIDTSYLLRNRKKDPLFSPINTKKHKNNASSHQISHDNLNPQKDNSYKKPFISVLRTPRQSILQKQKKKVDLQKAKENSFLREYVKKMEAIQQTRKRVRFQRKIPQTTVAKLINRDYIEEEHSRKKNSKSSVQQAVNNKGSFSQLYHKKLQQKKQKKSFFLSQSIVQGDTILKDDERKTNKFKLNKLIRQTQNQLARKQNFRYMEKFVQNPL